MLTLRNVSKIVGKHTVLEDVSETFEPGERVSLFGPSGSGKSMLLSLLIAAETPTSGTVEIDGVDLRRIPAPILQIFRRRIGMMFSDLKLLADRTVAENIAYPLEVCGIADAVIQPRISELLEHVGLSLRAHTPAAELTRSEQVKVALARALASKPLILFVDDPFRMLDRAEIGAFLELLHRSKTTEMTMLCTTSDPWIADQMAGRVLQLDNGRIVPRSQAETSSTEAPLQEPQRQSRSEHARPAPKTKASFKEEIPLGILADKPSKQVKATNTPRKIKVTSIGS